MHINGFYVYLFNTMIPCIRILMPECSWSDQFLLKFHKPHFSQDDLDYYDLGNGELDISLIFQLLIFIERENPREEREEEAGGRARPITGHRQPQSSDYNIVTL